MAVKLFEEVLAFDKVEVCEDLSKDEILQKLKELEEESEAYESQKDRKTVYALAVVWIGHKLSQDYPEQIEIKNEKQVKDIVSEKDQSEYTKEFVLTRLG